jgi:hypothetical protein
MRIAYGEGIVVAILLPVVLFLFGLVRIYFSLFLIVLLFGLWTIVASFLLVRREELRPYLTWGLILSCASSIFVISLAYAIAIILVGVIASVFVFVTGRK